MTATEVTPPRSTERAKLDTSERITILEYEVRSLKDKLGETVQGFGEQMCSMRQDFGAVQTALTEMKIESARGPIKVIVAIVMATATVLGAVFARSGGPAELRLAPETVRQLADALRRP